MFMPCCHADATMFEPLFRRLRQRYAIALRYAYYDTLMFTPILNMPLRYATIAIALLPQAFDVAADYAPCRSRADIFYAAAAIRRFDMLPLRCLITLFTICCCFSHAYGMLLLIADISSLPLSLISLIIFR